MLYILSAVALAVIAYVTLNAANARITLMMRQVRSSAPDDPQRPGFFKVFDEGIYALSKSAPRYA